MNPVERKCVLSVPNDLVQDILSRLGVKDLLRLRCINKEWRTFIDDTNFIRKHYDAQHSICKGKGNGNMPHFVYNGGDSETFCLVYVQQGEMITLNLNADLERDSKDVVVDDRDRDRDRYDIISDGCVNGIICLNWKHRDTELNNFLSLWNPATREFKAIAYPNMPPLIQRSHFEVYGFGFDPLSNDFKILGLYSITEFSCYYEMYSLQNNCWKRLREPKADIGGIPMPTTDGYLNGVYYWTAEISGGHLVIVSLNFSTEVFEVSDPPQDAVSLHASQIYPSQTTITLYKECLALAISHTVQEEALLYSIDIWVVTRFDDCGVPLSWQHLFTVEPVHANSGLQLAASRIDGHLLISSLFPSEDCASDQDSECWLYNPSTTKYTKLETDFCTWFRYLESLFPLSKRLDQV